MFGFACVVQSDETLNVTITADPPVDTTLCEGDIITLTCQVSDVTQPLYKWSSTKLNITEQTSSIKIVAAIFTIHYYCTVFDAATNRSGEGSIVVAKSSKSCSVKFKFNLHCLVLDAPPVLHKTNFENRLDVEEGGSVNLTVEVFSNMSAAPTKILWSGPDGLPENTVLTHYVINGVVYISLTFTNAVANDTGNYSFIAINECGTSNLYVYIAIDMEGTHWLIVATYIPVVT